MHPWGWLCHKVQTRGAAQSHPHYHQQMLDDPINPTQAWYFPDLSLSMHLPLSLMMPSKNSSMTFWIQTTPVSNKVRVFGNFKARFVCDHCTSKGILGHHGIGNCNTNGHLLLGLCEEHNLTVNNILFQLPNWHKKTKQPAPKIQALAHLGLFLHLILRQKGCPHHLFHAWNG